MNDDIDSKLAPWVLEAYASIDDQQWSEHGEKQIPTTMPAPPLQSVDALAPDIKPSVSAALVAMQASGGVAGLPKIQSDIEQVIGGMRDGDRTYQLESLGAEIISLNSLVQATTLRLAQASTIESQASIIANLERIQRLRDKAQKALDELIAKIEYENSPRGRYEKRKEEIMRNNGILPGRARLI